MELVQELLNCKFKLEVIDKSIDNSLININNIENELSILDRNLKNTLESKQYYKKAIDIVYERSIEELKNVINCALNYIFNDKNLQMDIELSDKRGKSMTFVVKHNNRKVNLKRGMGMGVKCVISCIDT